MRWQSIALPDGAAVRTCFVQQGRQGCASEYAIVLLHGFDSSLLEFRAILPRLAQHCCVWAIDLLGFGFSARQPQMQVNPIRIRQHLFQFCQQIEQPIILVGASMGGAVAIDFALHHPERVEAIGLIDSVGFSGSVAGEWLPPMLDRPATGWLRLRKRAALEAAVLSGNIILADAIACALLHQELPYWADAIASFTRSGGYGYLAQQISQVAHPTLILWGTNDDVLGTADAKKFEQAIDRSQLQWLPCGHLPHLEQPEAVIYKILTLFAIAKR
ncbi:alpha/beta hydrolase [Microcoleus sp. FACHB-1515]|nr:alpha/beta hydrolase [Microcoleus sp. FACHB-1515]